jgi:hypothetical protein
MENVFRQKYKALDDSTKSWMISFKEQAQTLYDNFDSCISAMPDSDRRMMALAKTNLEQAIMWAIKSIT